NHNNIPVLVLSMHDEYLYAQRALHAGARGYIMKQEAMESVVTAVRHVLSGKIYLNENVKEHILSNIAGTPKSRDKTPIDRLTDRELQVFKLVGRGFSTKEIAERLFLSIKTIGTYRERIKEKLHIKNANELLRFAVHFEKTGQILPKETT
ncbi:MAG: response regulator transcription factor, partial [Desulfobacteraceae bacterium]|nr:response regulator transcription factor [Desulfobacteraceae bacterium]